ncbi:carboxypeptidase-like regulatory domain-containing protein [Ginsengibacter hankyongi]|uniref:Carboxypeptidase-like regulatory domain-containing protein n=1 Tax=Ginsengibacter hankyongi TaxID=2607284 RepID=A0A5J5IL23_9BACT|nr:DUF5686 and carboxypeptidase-like regulatory domain-containing protein [Ginsengibacter hankyongi]KAA9041766.1 carboxypeptidase-like regulatory domain-containing protein [Ginsengibacter hankyongi]
MCLLFLAICGNMYGQERLITGVVTDAKTGQPLFSCSVYALNSGNGVITDEKGKYTFSISDKTDSIAISMIGYQIMAKAVSKAPEQVINFEAEHAANEMAAVVLSIKPKYTKAQRLILKVIKNKPVNDAFNNKTFQCQVYDKMEADLKNLPEKLQKNRLMRPLAFAFNNQDTTADHDKLLPVFISETNSNYYYRKNPEKDRYDYTAIKSSGFDNKSILTFVDGLYKKINIYDNFIKLADVNFESPIADNALNAYEYHILDTVYFGSHRCIQVQFSPAHFGSNTFNGYLWIADTSYAIKSLVMHMDKNANINFVKKFEISQFFQAENQQKFLPEKTILYMDVMVPLKTKIGVIARKTTIYKDIILNNNSIDTAFEKKYIPISAYSSDSAKVNPIQRFEPLTKSERSVYVLMDTLTKIPAVVTYAKIISALTTGYYTAGHVDIGNIYYTYTNNIIEGDRVTFGLKTNYKFNGRIQLKGYAGYAFRDKQFRYLLRSVFVLNPHKWSTLTLEHSNDISGTYDHSDELDQNSIFAAFLRRVKYSQSRLINSQYTDVNFLKYLSDDWAIRADINHNVLTPFFSVYYTNGDFKPYLDSLSESNHYTVNDATFSLRWSHKERYITQHYRRGSLGGYYPIITLSFTKGVKTNSGLLKSDFNFSKWNLYLEHNFPDGRIGNLSYFLDAGITKGTLPIVLLNVLKGNDTYYYNKYAFNNMNRFEFVTDKYVSLSVEQNFGSFPFKYIPVMKRLKWRSLITFKGVVGGMSEANKIANGYYDSTISYHFTVPDKSPYMETGVGIDNIFHALRIDGVWRLNYLNNPGIPKFGLKVSAEFKF